MDDLRVRVDLPSGTVTFLFTDVEGSTRLLQELGAQGYAVALGEHRRVLREAFSAHGGVEVDTQGDAFFVAFPTVSGALRAAEAGRDGLAPGLIRVRMGVHTGTPFVTDEGYVGEDVNRAARIAAAGHGGQVLVSQATAGLTDGATLMDLGEHRFKDLRAPERVFQLGNGVFPSLKSLYRTNLPVPATAFLGREAELAAVVGLLTEDRARLVSLVGPGGTGKTRLALQATAEAADGFPDGVFWVPLAPLRDPTLVLPTIATALNVAEGNDGTPVDDLARALSGRRLLVFVDNLEHLLPTVAEAVNAFVAACPSVTVVVTTRERLQIPSERVYQVPTMNEADGESLFRSRAAAAGVELEPSAEIGELCGRLDNLPLALELAAARTVVFSPSQLLDRLGQRLDLLKAGRGVDARQETLRGTIAWSHDLLTLDEQALFRRLSVFAGGCDYGAAEQAAGADPDTLQSLLDKSLLRRRDGEKSPRYWMLETIREYAVQQLEAADETSSTYQRHLDYYAALAEDCFDDPYVDNDDLDRLAAEHENLRVAFDNALETNPEQALELSRTMWPLWDQRGEYREGQERVMAARARSSDTHTSAYAWATRTAGYVASHLSDLATATNLSTEALSLFRELGEQRGIGLTLNNLGSYARERGDYADAKQLFQEAVEVLDDDEQLRRVPKMNLAIVAWDEGDFDGAVTQHREVVAYCRRQASSLELAIALNNLGLAQQGAGDVAAARASLEESVEIAREAEGRMYIAASLHSLGHLLQATDPDDALTCFAESLLRFRESDNQRGIAYCLEGCAVVYSGRGDHAQAARLLGAATAFRNASGTVRNAHEQVEADTVEAACRQMLTRDAFVRAWDEGTVLDANAAADWALQHWEKPG